MSVARRTERQDDVYYEQSALIREIRELVADQIHDLVVEREELGTLNELVDRINTLGRVHRDIQQAHGRARQAREMGAPTGAHVRAAAEGRTLLRQTVMMLGAACGAVAIGMDFDDRKHELELLG